ncbi:Permease YjgP/YjgQ family protein [Operophtera brumata]|uniref:Permease YjgP/YjgQ family protein n=1 Tax=Operophtera brumata TaxID=104452 RepID=A0A0L7LLC2_OPEBR|nr:Permease YjgP/YjgQ family protein [Operophtera brumata]
MGLKIKPLTPQMVIIRDILLFSSATENYEKNIIERILETISPYITPDWKDWRIEDFQPHQLLGDPPDTKLINKLRYAIPTSSIASAFGLTELSEKTYRVIKLKMLNWPLTRTLIYSPYSISAKIHGDNIDNWLKVVKTMKPLLLSRTETDDRLKKDTTKTPTPRSTSTPRKTPSRTRSLQTPEDDNGNKAIAAALQKQTEIEVEKGLEASPIFTALKINPHLANATPKWCSSENIIKLDQTCAVFKHVLLLQRQAFEEGIQKVAQEAGMPSVAESIHRNLLSKESKFRKLSDKAIQYACGRRAEAIATKRSFYKPPNIGLESLLKSIPPSLTHLLDEEKLNECRMVVITSFFRLKNTINQRIRKKTASTAQSDVANKQVQKSPIQAVIHIPKRNPILKKKLLKAENSDYRGFVAGGFASKQKFGKKWVRRDPYSIL